MREVNLQTDTKCPEPCDDAVSRKAAIDAQLKDAMWVGYRKGKQAVQPEIIHCKECKYGVQDEDKRWFCRSLGCQIGNEDGSGYCADAERRTDDSISD